MLDQIIKQTKHNVLRLRFVVQSSLRSIIKKSNALYYGCSRHKTRLHAVFHKLIVINDRTMQTIDGIAATLSDPQLTVHWSCCNSSTEASCRVIITSQGYDLR